MEKPEIIHSNGQGCVGMQPQWWLTAANCYGKPLRETSHVFVSYKALQEHPMLWLQNEMEKFVPSNQPYNVSHWAGLQLAYSCLCASVHGATVLPNPITVLPDLFTEEHFGWPQRAYHMHLHAATTAVTTSTLGTKCAMWIEWSSTCLSLNSLSVGKLQPPANEMILKHASNCLSNCLSIYRMFLCCLHPQRSLS